jgi:hypothetical protein
MNTRSRFTLSAVLGLALAGVCIGSAQAQSGMKHMMKMEEGRMKQPAPIDYPFAAPGTLHLYHYDDYTHESISEESASMKQMDNRMMQDKMMRDGAMMREDRMMGEGYFMTDENGMMVSEEEMMEPAPIGYPFAGPGSLHLYHFTDYTMEGLAEQSATMKKMDNMHMQDKMMHDGMMMDEEMMEPAPIGYPFAAPGGLHLYHYDNYAGEGLSEGSATMAKMDKAEKMEKKSMKRMK